MTLSVKERVKRNLEEYALWYDAVFLARKTECKHLHCGSQFESVSGTAWQKIGEFEKSKEICIQCGKTVRILFRKAKGA